MQSERRYCGMYVSWPLLQGNICKKCTEYGSVSSIRKQDWICPMIKIKNCPTLLDNSPRLVLHFPTPFSCETHLTCYTYTWNTLCLQLPPQLGFHQGVVSKWHMCCRLRCSLVFLASQTNYELINQANKQPQADGFQETSGESSWLWLSLTLSWSPYCTLSLTW